MNNIERTLVIIKPDATIRGLSGVIREQLEGPSVRCVAMMNCILSLEALSQLYDEHKSKPFFQVLMKTMMQGPSIILVYEGKNVIENMLELSSSKIRSNWGLNQTCNSIHRSADTENASREIKLFFPYLTSDNEIIMKSQIL